MKIKVENVKVRDGRRMIDHAKVKKLAASIKEVGLINPITLTRDNTLVAGSHRLEAFKYLECEYIEASLLESEDSLKIELAEIDENLVRNELHWTEQDDALARRKEIYEELYPETRHGGDRKSEKSNGQNVHLIKKSFTEDASEKLGQTARNVRRSIHRSTNIDPALKPRLKELDLTKTEGSFLAKLEPEKQKAIIETKASRPDASVKDVLQEMKKQEKRRNFDAKKAAFEHEETSGNVIIECHHGSCLNFLQDFDKPIDLVLTDPPYAMDFKSGWNDWGEVIGDKRNDTIPLLDKTFSLLKSKMKNDAHIYVFGNPNEVENVKPIFEKYFKLKNILIWDREVIGMGDLKTYGRSYDIIYFGFNEKWKELNGIRDRDVLRFNRVPPSNLIHPTEKPGDILKYIIKKSSKVGDVVCDPFAGSCSTLKAAKELGRNSYGSELESKYIPKWILKVI